MTDKELEKELLKRLYDRGWQYIARDKWDCLCAFTSKPEKKDGIWYANEFVLELECVKYVAPTMVEEIQWTDEEPFDIGEYLGIVDWENIPVDTKVLVRDGDDYPWKRAYFKRYHKESLLPFEVFGEGRTSWSAKCGSYQYKQCKLWVEEEYDQVDSKETDC